MTETMAVIRLVTEVAAYEIVGDYCRVGINVVTEQGHHVGALTVDVPFELVAVDDA